ncbi:MAG: hypothetical protein CSA81_01065 [Acidobacteria bacterium]|nr:MAG: hypothetical protein CSA81_01065 [Acidobacteriota bacterium]PIE90361.1 MAG: hypothetical protein CR997_06115 [Acidobacteriota bacterium]
MTQPFAFFHVLSVHGNKCEQESRVFCDQSVFSPLTKAPSPASVKSRKIHYKGPGSSAGSQAETFFAFIYVTQCGTAVLKTVSLFLFMPRTDIMVAMKNVLGNGLKNHQGMGEKHAY